MELYVYWLLKEWRFHLYIRPLMAEQDKVTKESQQVSYALNENKCN